MKISTAPDFQALCPKLSDEEFRLLEESIIDEGCRDPLVVWQCGQKALIVDGHTRYAICTKYRIPFKTRLLKLESRQAAMGWAARNQLGRRNATEEQKSYLRGKLYRETKGEQGGDRKSNCQNGTLIGDTAEKIAEETGVSPRTVHRDESFSESVDALSEKSETLKHAALQGEIPKSAVVALASASKATLKKLERLEGKELREAVREVAKPEYGKCPNCAGTKWDKDEDGVSCAKCGHPHGEPAGDADEERLQTQRQKTVKTVEALMRAFDDLQAMKAKREHAAAIESCKALLKVARGWK